MYVNLERLALLIEQVNPREKAKQYWVEACRECSLCSLNEADTGVMVSWSFLVKVTLTSLTCLSKGWLCIQRGLFSFLIPLIGVSKYLGIV